MKRAAKLAAVLAAAVICLLPAACKKSVVITLDYHFDGIQNRTVSLTSGETFWEIPLREDCAFVGWYYDAEYTRAFERDTPVTEDLTLHAKWREGAFYVYLCVELNGSETGYELEVGESMELPGCGVRQDGYGFYGWRDGSKVYREGDVYELTTPQDVTLYAEFRELRRIRFLANGGSGSIVPLYAMAGETVTLPDGSAFYLQDRTVIGWEYQEKLYIPGSQFTVPAADVDFSAVWGKHGESIS